MSSRVKIASKLTKKAQEAPAKKQHRFPVKLDIQRGKVKRIIHPEPHKPVIKPYVASTRLDKWVWDTLLSYKEEEKSLPPPTKESVLPMKSEVVAPFNKESVMPMAPPLLMTNKPASGSAQRYQRSGF